MLNSTIQLIKKINNRGFKDFAWRLMLYGRSLCNSRLIQNLKVPTCVVPDIIIKNNDLNRICGIVTAEQKKRVINEANNIIHNRLVLFNSREYDFGEEIDWLAEPDDRTRWSGNHKNVANTHDINSIDIRMIWELNRHKHFVTLAKAYNYTKEIRYYEKFASHFTDWLRKNPYGIGINWSSTLEVAMRAISWLWAYHLFRFIPQFSELEPRFLEALLYHARHIYNFRSEHLHPTNHIIGEAAALYMLCIQFRSLDDSYEWKHKAKQIIEREVKRQIFNDGGSKEQSFSYQRFVLDLLLQVLIFSKAAGDIFSDNFTATLQKMIDFIMYSTGPNNEIPMIGDSDTARGLPLISNREFWVEKDIFCLGAILYERKDFKFFANEFTESAAWMLGEDGYKRFCTMTGEEPKAKSWYFEDSGYIAMRDSWSNGLFLMLDAGSLGIGKVCGHAHADQLNFVLSVFGKDIVIDPGTYTYTNKSKYRNYFRSAFAHNTLVVDDKPLSRPLSNFDWDRTTAARTIRWQSNTEYDVIEAYYRCFKNLVHKRKCILIKGIGVLIQDTLHGKGSHKVDIYIHLAPAVEVIEIAKRKVWLKTSDVYVTVYQNNNRSELKAVHDVFSQTYDELMQSMTIISTTRTNLPVTLITMILPSRGRPIEPSPSKINGWIEQAYRL